MTSETSSLSTEFFKCFSSADFGALFASLFAQPSPLLSIRLQDPTTILWVLIERTPRPSLGTSLLFVAWRSFGLHGGSQSLHFLSNRGFRRWHGCPSGAIGFKEAITDSCAFGSIHRKPFRWLGWGVDLENMNVRCPGGHQHVQIEGTLTKASAVYHPGLAAFIAEKIKDAVFANDAPDEKKPAEIESVILNDLLQKAGWKVEGDWWWKQPAHINVLESRSLVALFKHLVVSGGNVRFNALLDSRVAKGAHAKGRSTARALRPSLMRGCALCLAGNLHPSYGFAPTRLNTADAPTRERDLPSPATHSVLDFLSYQQISQVHSYQFSRATTGWVRLYLLVVFCLCPVESAPLDSVESCSGFWTFPLWIFQALSHVDSAYLANPCLFLGMLGLFAVWIFLLGVPGGKHRIKIPKIVLPVFLALAVGTGIPCSAVPLLPTGHDETSRASRRAGCTLQADRVILPQTRNRRDALLSALDTWLAENMRTTLD